MDDIFSEELVDIPDDIERVVEGGRDEIQEGSDRESGNEEPKNENEDAKDADKVKVKRKLGPRPTLNAQRLKGPRGIGIMESFFSDINLQGKGKEKEDLDLIMRRLEHWAHRLFPRMQFDDALNKIEKLGSKKEISNYMKRIRLGMEDDESVIDTGIVDEPPDSPPPPPSEDTFDQLIASVPTQPPAMEMTSEQRERMLQNRLIAEERRNARLKRAKELKEKFLANQAQTQNENTQTSESQQKAQNEKNDAELSNQHELEMEVDENVVSENDFASNSLIIRDNRPDAETERHDNMIDLTERLDNNLGAVSHENDNDDFPMETADNYPDILLESNNAQPDIIEGNMDRPDIVQRISNEVNSSRLSVGNQSDVLSSQNNLPDILVGSNEMNGPESRIVGGLNVHSDSIGESYDPGLERRGNQPDVLQ